MACLTTCLSREPESGLSQSSSKQCSCRNLSPPLWPERQQTHGCMLTDEKGGPCAQQPGRNGVQIFSQISRQINLLFFTLSCWAVRRNNLLPMISLLALQPRICPGQQC